MPKLTVAKNNFTAGEIAPDLWGRADLQGYMNGAARLRNVLLRPTGGVSRRPGLRHVALLPAGTAEVRLIAFSFNTEQTYLLVLADAMLRVFRGDVEVFAGTAPWTRAMLKDLAWTQSADTLFLCHPELPTQRITRHSHADWRIASFVFARDGEDGATARHEPMFRFAPADVTLTPGATTGSTSLTASADVFQPGHAGVQLRLRKKALRIDGISGPRDAQVTVLQDLGSLDPTDDWEEAAFSPVRGWPVCATIYQDRLVLAGSRDLPNRVWLSRTSELENFDLGTALDDQSIEFALLGDQVDAIRAVVAGRHLQVFTSGAEWMVTGEPLTPVKLRAERQTRIGSLPGRTIPPRHVDGATLFLARTGRELREFLYTDIDQAYSAADLALLSGHVFAAGPVDHDYAPADRLFLVVMADGTVAALTIYRAQQVAAWTRLDTAGAIRAVAVVDATVFVAVERDGRLRIERFAPDSFTDAAIAAETETPQAAWPGLDHLEGRDVLVVADGLERGPHRVAAGQVTLAAPAGRVEIGLAYTHEIRPLPPELGNGQVTTQAAPVRLVRAVFRLHETAALCLDAGQGLRRLPFARTEAALDTAPPRFSGDVEQRGLGWVRGTERPLWRIEQDVPLPCTLLSVIADMKGAE